MITKHMNMKTLIHRLMHWLFPEIPPPKVPPTTHRVEDVPEIVRKERAP